MCKNVFLVLIFNKNILLLSPQMVTDNTAGVGELKKKVYC